MRYKIGLILILSVGLASYLLYNFVYLSSASGKTIELPIRNESDNQKLDISLGFELKDITNSAIVDEFVARFRGMPVYLKLSNPLPSTINDPNFTKLQDAGVFWQFSSNSYEVLDAAAASYYEKFQGKVLLELTDHNSVDPSKSTVMMAKFPSAKFYADDSFAWSRERVREMVDTKTSSVAIPYPILDGVSFHTSQIKNDVFDDAKSTFDYFYDASSNVQGTSIKIDWGAGNHNLMVSEIKTKTNLDGAEASTQEARKFGILIAAYFNYAQMRGGETNASTKKPIRYVGLGDYSLLSPNSKNLARFFALMTKRRQNISYPNTHRANGNPWDGGFLDPASKPLIGIGTHSSEHGYMIVFSNGSNEEITLEISTNINFSGYKTISNFRADGATISPSRQIVFAPYEVIAVYKDSGEDIAPTPTPAPITSSTPTPAPSTTQPSNTPQPTNTTAPSNSPTKTPSLTPTKTKTPTPSSTPTPSQTLTPTKTPTTTLTPTPTPTPILKAFCDTAGCGICGWRGTNGVCQPGGAMPDGNRCCYSTCVNDLCKTVAGFGTDKCSPGQACISPTASYDSRSITTPTPVIKYVVIEPTATIANATDISTSPKSSMAPVKVTLTSVVTSTISNNAQNTTSPPVSGSDSTILLLLIIPAIILVAGAFIF